MPSLNIWLKKGIATHAYVLAAIAIVLCVVSAMSFWTSATVRSAEPPPVNSPQVAGHAFVPTAQRHPKEASPAPDSVTMETVMLTPNGFEPKEINRSEGKFVLGIDNRIKPDEFSFELIQENGHSVRKLKMPKGQIRLRKMLNLPAGRYLLKEVDHPEWTCSIVLSQ